MKQKIPGLIILLFICNLTFAEFFNYSFSSFSTLYPENLNASTIGLRFLPEISIALESPEITWIDVYAQGRWSSNQTIHDFSALIPQSSAELYRFWGRGMIGNFECRLGLQKINFGPARVLRSLRWFDTLSPTDPLQQTKGVTGFLVRHFADDNSNTWGWLLYGNDRLKGNEMLPTAKAGLEFGGRHQRALPFSGEGGISLHSRPISNASGTLSGYEFKLGLDAIWDLGWGVWGEAVMSRSTASLATNPWAQFVTLGTDTTLDVGNGLYLLIEHAYQGASDQPLSDFASLTQTSAIQVTYPLNLIDSIQSTYLRSWATGLNALHLTWTAIYDQWSVYLTLFKDEISGQNLGLQFIGQFN